jgi:carbon monoxide dehydrogenase subunit G
MFIYPWSLSKSKKRRKRNDFGKENQMAGFNRNEWISRSPQEVFEFLASADNASKVVQSVKSMIKLTEGPVRVGTRYRETRLMNGKEAHAELEVVEYEPVQKYAMRNVTEGIETVYRYTFRPEANGTRVDLACEVNAGGLKKVMLPLVVSVLKKEDGDHLQRLKTALEL